MCRGFAAAFAVFGKLQFVGSIDLVFLCDVILGFAYSTN